MSNDSVEQNKHTFTLQNNVSLYMYNTLSYRTNSHTLTYENTLELVSTYNT